MVIYVAMVMATVQVYCSDICGLPGVDQTVLPSHLGWLTCLGFTSFLLYTGLRLGVPLFHILPIYK